MAGGGGQQGAAAPAQGGANAFSGSTNPTPYQGSAAPQNLGQAAGAQGSFADQNQQAQSNALGAISAPAGGGQNAMGPNVFGGGLNSTAGGPYGGFNAQGQNAVGNAQSNYNQSGGQGQLTPPQQAAIAYNANPQAQSNALGAISAPAGGPYGGFNAQGQGNPANYQPSQEAINTYDKWKADQDRPLGPGEMRNQMAMLDPRSPEAMQMQMMQANRAQQPQGQEQFQNNIMRPMPMPQPQGPMSVGAFSPQSPMGGFPQQPQGGGPDMTGMTPGSDMGYDQSGSDAGIGGQAVQGVQNPAGMGGKMSSAGGPYGGIMAGRPVMDQGEIPPSLSQMRPQKGGLQVQGNPTAQPFMRKSRAAQQR